MLLYFMHWSIITIGKPGQGWVRAALDLYWKRLCHYTRADHVIIKEGPREKIEQQILTVCGKDLCIVLDERGASLRSVELAGWIQREEIAGRKRVCVVLGGAEGHSAEFLDRAQVCWSLSKLTFQHDMALIILVEQVYRAYSILRGEPYHRE